MAVNTAGYVILGDNAFPDTITMRATATISGGQFVSLGSIAASVSSGANSFVGPADIQVAAEASGTNLAVGVATQNVASGGDVVVIRKGEIIATAAGAFAPGERVQVASNDAVTIVGSASNPITVTNRVVGTAYTGAGSEGFAIVRLNL